MYRKDLIPLLLERPYSVTELAYLMDETPRDLEQDLQHLLKSLRRMPYHAVIEPAKCRRCGFVFHHDKLRKPGKCPRCKGTRIREPFISVREAGDG